MKQITGAQEYIYHHACETIAHIHGHGTNVRFMVVMFGLVTLTMIRFRIIGPEFRFEYRIPSRGGRE